MKNYTGRPVPFMGQYPFLIILSACASGIFLQSYLAGITSLYWVIPAVLLFIITTILFSLRSLRPKINAVRLTVLILEFILLGATLSSTADIRNTRSWYGHYLNKTEAITVSVTDFPVVKEKTILVPATVESVSVSGKWIKVGGPIKIYIYRKNFTADYKPGQQLIIPNKIVAIKNSGNPFSFDLVKMSERNGFFHQAFLDGDDVCAIPSGTITVSPIRRLSVTLQASINKNVKDSTTRALIAATLLNERSDLDENLMAAYSNTGIIHIIAISLTITIQLIDN